jgi:hypothetical protein
MTMTSNITGSVKCHIDPKRLIVISKPKDNAWEVGMALHAENNAKREAKEEAARKIIQDKEEILRNENKKEEKERSNRRALENRKKYLQEEAKELEPYTPYSRLFRVLFYLIPLLVVRLVFVGARDVWTMFGSLPEFMVFADSGMLMFYTMLYDIFVGNCIWFFQHNAFFGIFYTYGVYRFYLGELDNIGAYDFPSLTGKFWKTEKFQEWCKMGFMALTWSIFIATAVLGIAQSALPLESILKGLKSILNFILWDGFIASWNTHWAWGVIYFFVVDVIAMFGLFMDWPEAGKDGASGSSDRTDFWGRLNHLELFNIEKAITKLGNRK